MLIINLHHFTCQATTSCKAKKVIFKEIIEIKNIDDSETKRMGRSRTMIKKDTNEVICHVYELLNIERYLFAAKNHVAKA